MKYIRRSWSLMTLEGRHRLFRGYDHRPYWRYLAEMTDQMPPHIYKFASSTENHDLTSPQSLHDAWLDYWTVKEVLAAESASHGHRLLQIEARFLGPQQDRLIYLTYGRVKRYQTKGIASPARDNKGHSDVLIHELTLEADGSFRHELVFASGSTFGVWFSDFEHRVEGIEKGGKHGME